MREGADSAHSQNNADDPSIALSDKVDLWISALQYVSKSLDCVRRGVPDVAIDENTKISYTNPIAQVAVGGRDVLSLVRHEIDKASDRNALFPRVTTGDPAWSILLDLFEAKMTGKSRAIKSACLASGVPATTALRYLDLLVCEGYVERSFDPADGRRVLVSLTPLANKRILRFFS